MRISKERLEAVAKTTGFRAEVLEKVIHLLSLLDGFRSHHFLKTEKRDGVDLLRYLNKAESYSIFNFSVPEAIDKVQSAFNRI